jgi:hypothetical protein
MAKEIAYKVTVDTGSADENTEKLSKSIDELTKQIGDMSKHMENGFKAGKQAAKKTESGIKSLIKSLGLLGVAMAVFEFMKDIVSRNQKVMDALNTATTAFEILLYKLFDAAKPLGDALKSAFENPFESLVKLKDFVVERFMVAMKGFGDQFIALGSIIESALEFDWDGVTKGAEDFGDALLQTFTATTKAERQSLVEDFKNFASEVANSTKASIAQADALVQLRKEVELAEVEQRKLMLQYQNEAELQRQTRDDISLTIAERQAANDRIKEIQDEQIQREKELANKRLELANAEIAVAGETTELLRQKAEAELELADIEERITSQRSEQKTNEKALQEELRALQEELRIEQLEGREREIEKLQQHYDHLAEIARKAGEDRFEVEAQRANALNELNKKFYDEDAQNAIKAAKEKADAEEKINQAKLTAATQTAGALGTIAQAVENQGKAGLVASKVIAGAQIAIDTATAISGAIAAANKNLTFPANIAAIATGIASVLANVSKATQLLGSVNVGGGVSVTIPSASAATAAAQAPQVTPVTTNTTELGNTQQAELAPIQAFVVETQLTGTQNDVSQIEGQAEFGG